MLSWVNCFIPLFQTVQNLDHGVGVCSVDSFLSGTLSILLLPSFHLTNFSCVCSVWTWGTTAFVWPAFLSCCLCGIGVCCLRPISWSMYPFLVQFFTLLQSDSPRVPLLRDLFLFWMVSYPSFWWHWPVPIASDILEHFRFPSPVFSIVSYDPPWHLSCRIRSGRSFVVSGNLVVTGVMVRVTSRCGCRWWVIGDVDSCGCWRWRHAWQLLRLAADRCSGLVRRHRCRQQNLYLWHSLAIILSSSSSSLLFVVELSLSWLLILLLLLLLLC